MWEQPQRLARLGGKLVPKWDTYLAQMAGSQSCPSKSKKTRLTLMVVVGGHNDREDTVGGRLETRLTCCVLTRHPQAFVSPATHFRPQKPFSAVDTNQSVCSKARPSRQALKSKPAAALLPGARQSSTQQQTRVRQLLGKAAGRDTFAEGTYPPKREDDGCASSTFLDTLTSSHPAAVRCFRPPPCPFLLRSEAQPGKDTMNHVPSLPSLGTGD